MHELRRRGLIRTGNNPVADYAEWLVAQCLSLQLAKNSKAGYDAMAADGTRYQVKARRLAGGSGDRQLGVIRNIQQRGFDYLIVVLFDPNLAVQEMWQLPYDLVYEKAQYNRHQNGHVLFARDSVLADPRAERLSDVLPPKSSAVPAIVPGRSL
jgi:hypothetical protein